MNFTIYRKITKSLIILYYLFCYIYIDSNKITGAMFLLVVVFLGITVNICRINENCKKNNEIHSLFV